jgi:large subunit ribosomal protein L25
VLNIVRHEIDLYCPADSIPEEIVIDLAGVDLGDSIHISAVKLPDNVTPAIRERDFTIATIAAPAGLKEEEEEAAAAAATAEAAPVAGEAPPAAQKAPAAGAPAAPAAAGAVAGKDAKAAPAAGKPAPAAKAEKKK